jgi:protein-arginine kinase activator protein McsA
MTISDVVPCEDCEAPATITWGAEYGPKMTMHLCESCAERRCERAYEGPQDAPDVPPRADND